MSVLMASVLRSLMTSGYFASWLSFGTNLTLVALNSGMITFIKLEENRSKLLPYATIDCILICLQFTMIAIEANWFVKTDRVEFEYLEAGYPLATLTNALKLLVVVVLVLQFIKIAIVGLNWPLSNDATAVFTILKFGFTLLNAIIFYFHRSIMRLDKVQQTAIIVVLSLAFLLGWGAVGSTLVMMDIESKESYELLFEFELVTSIVHIVNIILLHYLAHNMHMLKGSPLYS
jgi:hypothetical protein